MPEWGSGGPLWAQTRSKRRPESQDHFPSPPGSKNHIQKSKKYKKHQNPRGGFINPAEA